MVITKNLSNTEEREEEKERWRIYILEILIAMSDKCEIEHMLFFILSNVCHRLSNACSTFAIVSSLDDVRAFDDAFSMTSELSMTLSFNDEQNIRHTILFSKSLNPLIWFLIHLRRLWLVWIFFVKVFHYFLCILKFFRIISRSIFVIIFSLD